MGTLIYSCAVALGFIVVIVLGLWLFSLPGDGACDPETALPWMWC